MNKTQYKLVAMDLDGTLLDSNSDLSEYTVNVLRAVEETGVKVTVCTGRAYAGSLMYLKQIGLRNPGVFCNGAQVRVSVDGKILRETPLSIEDARQIISLGKEFGAHPRVYMSDELYVSHVIEEDKVYSGRTGTPVNAVSDLYAFLDEIGKPPLKIINFVADPTLVPDLIEKNNSVFQDRLYITQSLSINKTIFVEYMNAAATKGSGIREMAGMYGFSTSEVVVGGDHLNDLTMFEEAGFSIAPANAHPDVLSAASAVCLSNDEDGVPKKLAEMFL